jgi:SAM-dependent methyltransferase
MAESTLQEDYDAVPYISGPIYQTHVDRLHLVARLNGRPAAPVDGCRVLELGCASGGNLTPMAAALPGSRFVGIDLSERQIAEARKEAAALGLANIDYRAMDMRDFAVAGPDEAFDYVIAHGLYCWIPKPLQDGFMAMLRPWVRPGGFAYISFNALPGWHQRQPVRDLMLRFTEDLKEPAARASQARAIFEVLLATCQRGGAFRAVLDEEQARVAALPDSFLLHDLMESENHPRYVGDVIEDAEAEGFSFVGEMNVAAGHPANFPDTVREVLAALPSVARRQDYIDFWSNRMFRECLFYAGRHESGPELDRRAFADLHLASSLRPETPAQAAEHDPPANPAERFYRAPEGGRVGLTMPAAIAAVDALIAAWPGSLPFAEVAAAAGDANAAAAVAHDLLLRNWIECTPRDQGIVRDPGSHPRAFAPALLQAREGRPVSGPQHRTLLPDDPLQTVVLAMLDGSRDRAQLAAALAELDASGAFDLVGEPPQAALERALAGLAGQRLLVA